MSITVSTPTDVQLPRPTRARYVVLFFLCSMAFVLYLDRVCISQALVPMKDEFGLSHTQTSYVLMAFTLAYGLFEIPTGRWGDRFGSRRVLTRIVLWWSAFTALTGCVWKFSYDFGAIPAPYFLSDWFDSIPIVFNSLVLLIVVRFLFGAGEAGAIPNAARILMHWFSPTERGTMQGRFQASMHVGGAIAPLVAAWIIDSPAGWRGTFVIFGGVGLVWAGFFYWWFRDKPAEHPAVNQAELQLIGDPPPGAGHGAVPWGEALRHPNVWLLGITITMSAFNSYFFFSWYSTYLQEARGVSNNTAGWLSALALAGATAGSLVGGLLADLITRFASDRYRARRRLCLISYFTAAGALLGSVNVDTPWVSALLCALACFLMFCKLPTWWACSFEVSGRHTGAMFGLLNGIGIIGAMGSQYFFGAFVDWRKNLGFEGRDRWDPAFYASIVLLIVAGILWQFIRQRPAVGEADAPANLPIEPMPHDTMETAIQAEPSDGSIREGPPPS